MSVQPCVLNHGFGECAGKSDSCGSCSDMGWAWRGGVVLGINTDVEQV